MRRPRDSYSNRGKARVERRAKQQLLELFREERTPAGGTSGGLAEIGRRINSRREAGRFRSGAGTSGGAPRPGYGPSTPRKAALPRGRNARAARSRRGAGSARSG